MVNYSKISLFLAFLVAIIISCWSAIPAPEPSGVSIDLLPILYHIGMFFLLGAFLFSSIWDNFKEENILLVVLFSMIYAIIDELHQFFVPGRGCNIHDFGFNCMGILSSFGFVLFFRMFRRQI